MARVPVVSRTIKSTKVTVMGVDLNSGEVMNKTMILPRTYKDEQKMLKTAKQKGETEDYKIVQVVDSVVEEKQYVMPEEKFVELANAVE